MLAAASTPLTQLSRFRLIFVMTHEIVSTTRTPYIFLPALLQKLVGEFFLIFRREIWKI